MTTYTHEELVTRAMALHDRIVTLDGHATAPLTLGDKVLGFDTLDVSQFDLAKAIRGKLKAVVLTLLATPARPGPEATAEGRRQLEARYQTIMDLVDSFPDRAAVAGSPQQLRDAVGGGKTAMVIGFLNASPLADDLDFIDRWVERGVRLFGFTFIGSNQWAESARPYPFVWPTGANGLSPLGVEGVKRLNDLGVIIDASQLSSRSFADVLEHSRSPVVASHSGVRGIVDIDRNFSDAELADIRQNGGLVQIVGFGPYVRPPSDQLVATLAELWRANGLEVTGRLADLVSVNDPVTATWDDDRFWKFLHEFHEPLDLSHPVATVADLVNAIDYAVERAGIDHVGISSDFNNGGGLADWRDAGQSLNVTVELLSRGYTDEQIEKLWGGNFLRVWEQVHRAARP